MQDTQKEREKIWGRDTHLMNFMILQPAEAVLQRLDLSFSLFFLPRSHLFCSIIYIALRCQKDWIEKRPQREGIQRFERQKARTAGQ